MVMRAGFSLVETIVAMTLLSVGALGVAAGGLLATRLLRDAELQEDLSNRASLVLDSLITNRVAGAGRIRADHYRIDWVAGSDSAVVIVHGADSSVFRLRATR